MSRRITENSTAGARDRPLVCGDLSVLQDGAGDAPAVLLIHGLAGSTAWWDPVVPTLARNFRVIRVDLPGHGQSPNPRHGYDTTSHARSVADALDELRVGRCCVVGHSTGGYVATALGEQRRDLVVAVTVIDTCPSPNAVIPQGVLSRLAVLPVPGRLLWRLQSDATIRRLLRAGAFFREVDISPDVIESIQNMTHRAFAETASGSLEYIRLRSLPDRLAALGVPVQVIFGDEDRRCHAFMSIDEYRVIPDVRTELMQGVGHSPMMGSTHDRSIAVGVPGPHRDEPLVEVVAHIRRALGARRGKRSRSRARPQTVVRESYVPNGISRSAPSVTDAATARGHVPCHNVPDAGSTAARRSRHD